MQAQQRSYPTAENLIKQAMQAQQRRQRTCCAFVSLRLEKKPEDLGCSSGMLGSTVSGSRTYLQGKNESKQEEVSDKQLI